MQNRFTNRPIRPDHRKARPRFGTWGRGSSWRLSVFLVAITIALLGCTATTGVETSDPVLLGALYNTSGVQSLLDVPSSQGATLAVTEANDAGGVIGRSVELLMEDGESEEAVVRDKTIELLEGHPTMSALLGMSDTDLGLAAARVAADNQRVFLTSGATSPKLPGEVPEYLFLACFGDNVQAAAGAEWAYNELGARTVSVLFNEQETYTQLLHGYFQTRFTGLGGEILAVESYTPGGDLSAPIGNLPSADLIFLSSESADEALTVIEALRQTGFAGPILGGDGLDGGEIWSQNPDVSDVYFTTHAYLGADNPDPQVVAFREAYITAYPDSEPTAFAALGYDAVNILLAAVTEANSSDPADVREALSTLQGFEGVTGTISYDSGDRIPKKSVTILEVGQGEFNLVKQFVPEQVPAP